MPSPRIIAAIVLLALLGAIIGGAAWQEHRVSVAQQQRDANARDLADMTQARIDALVEAGMARADVQVVTRYVDRVEYIQQAAKIITREVPVYVTQKADAACTVPVGFVRIHDAAATGTAPPAAARDPDAPAAGVTLSGIAGTVADNYAICHAIRAQLIGLQEWARKETGDPLP